MKIDNNISKLIAELEHEVGRQCYNPNSYDGYTGITGKNFRYPVCIIGKNSKKTYGQLTDLQPEQINSLVYKFGSNHLYIGKALVKILELLEEKYDLDFNELANIK